jgi:hypothetical protein
MDRSFGAQPPVPTVRKWRSGEVFLGRRVAAQDRRRSAAWRHMLGRLPVPSLVLACFGILSGCVDNVAQAPDPSAPPSTNMARRAGVSPGGATVAVASFAGAPQEVTDRFGPMFTEAAKHGEINMADPATANYLVRGYLTVRPEGDATAVAFVLDIFDSKKERTQRMEDEVLLKGQAADPWSLVDDSTLASVAAKSADDLAAVMSNTPEALLAANGAPSEGHNVAAEDGQTVVAATPPVSAPPPSAPPPSGFGLAALR